MIETAKEHIYREALENVSRSLPVNSELDLVIGEALIRAKYLPDSTDKLSVEKLQEQFNTAKYFFKNILDVDPNLNKGHVSHLENCVRVMKNSAEKALAAIGGDDED